MKVTSCLEMKCLKFKILSKLDRTRVKWALKTNKEFRLLVEINRELKKLNKIH